MLKEVIEILFSRYYVLNGEIKDFNVVTDEKRFFDLPVKKRRRNLRENYEHESK